MIACPICKEDLKPTLFDAVSTDVCAAHGVWLDHSELLAITEAERHKEHSFWEDLLRREIFPPRDPERVLACPHCAKPLQIEVYERVSMDWCPTHGVWLDRGEMEAILSNLRLDDAYLRRLALRIYESRY